MSYNNDTSAAAAEVVFEYTGEGCTVPKDVTIARFRPSVTEVEPYAFESCKHLKEIIFNDELKKIGGRAFSECSSLSSITFPSTLREIGYGTFYDCSNL